MVAKQAVALLLGAAALAQGKSVDGEKFDSNGDSQSSNEGFGNSIWQDSGRPLVIFYNDQDTTGNVYCLEFIEVFEAAAPFADLESPDVVSGSKFEFNNMDLHYVQNNDPADTTWDYRIFLAAQPEGAQFENLTFTFRGADLTADEGTFYGLKFDIEVDGYTWDTEDGDPDAHKFVVEFKLEDCTSEHSSEKDDEDDSDAEDDEAEEDHRRLQEEEQSSESVESEESAESDSSSAEGRRRLGEDDEADEEEEDEESSDSGEFMLDTAVFAVNPYAVDASGAEVNVTLVFGGDNDKLYVVFDKFDTYVKLDPQLFALAGAAPSLAASLAFALAALFAALL